MSRDVAETSIICYAPNMITTNGVWQGDNPLEFSLPLFVLQLTIIVLTTRLIVYILKPLRQPRVIAEILAGVILGPSVLGRNIKFANTLFPLRSVMVLETMANIGLLYFLFLVGLEMDISMIRRTGKRALAMASASMIIPFLIAAFFSYILHKDSEGLGRGTLIIFVGVALSVTAFPVLARVLAELKLVNTELGQIAMSTAVVNDICAWILLTLGIALAENEVTSLMSLWVVLSGVTFVAFCFLIVRPGINWIIRRTPEGENFSEFYICLILTGVMISGFITDAIGIHSVLGAFVFGLIIPNGPLGVTLIEKLEDFVSGLLIPLFFAISGLKTNVSTIVGVSRWLNLMIVIILSCAGKVIGIVCVTFFNDLTLREGVVVGLLLNTKGLIEMIVLNVGKDQKVLDDDTFAMMVITALVMTGIITPIVTIIYRPSKGFIPYKKRTMQKMQADSELRILVCLHSPKSVPTLINLLEASHPSKKSPICIYVLHLVELTGRASAMLIVHNTRKNGRPALNRTQAQSDHIIHAFENYEQHAAYVAVQPLTVISPYATMHEDIRNLAEDKRTTFIIIPFHKQQTVDGGMETTNPAYRIVNQNLLDLAPCSVGILVDRGLNGPTRLATSQVSYNVAVLYFGGPDDREGLACGWRMAQRPGTNLTVLRFVPGEDAAEPASTRSRDTPDTQTVLISGMDYAKERQLDEAYINEFKSAHVNSDSVVYMEKVVNNGEETVAGIRSMETKHDLIIVGRGQGLTSPLTAGLTDWSECPELGAIGDLLASSDFAASISVLVVQQFTGSSPHEEEFEAPESPVKSEDPLRWQSLHAQKREHMSDSTW